MWQPSQQTLARLQLPLLTSLLPLAHARWEVDCPSNMVNVSTVQELHSAIAAASSAGVLAVVNFFAEEC